jgi:DNA polymerase III subunit delta'
MTRVSATDAPDEAWAGVTGQDEVVRQLEAASRAPVHAYLLLGPPGVGKRALACGFAARLLAAGSEGADRDRHTRLALNEQHPDLRMVVPEGLTFRRVDAEELVHNATRAPVEADRKVIVALGCEAMEEGATGYLLKAVEEPSSSTVFVLVATEVSPELVTIASRCVRIEARPLNATAIVERLVAEGVELSAAESAANASAGDLERARTLASDEQLGRRHQFWRDLPQRLDGTGHTAAAAVAELDGLLDEALEPLARRQEEELAELTRQVEEYGLRAGAKKDLEARHKREQRRFRGAELRFGLATLAATYRDALVDTATPGPLLEAADRIDRAGQALARYPNETLLLQALVSRLPPLPRS